MKETKVTVYVDASEQGGLVSELRLLRRLVVEAREFGVLCDQVACHCAPCQIYREWDRTYGAAAKAQFKSMCKMCGNPGDGTVELEDAGCPVTLCVDCADREGLSALLVAYPRIDNRDTTL